MLTWTKYQLDRRRLRQARKAIPAVTCWLPLGYCRNLGELVPVKGGIIGSFLSLIEGNRILPITPRDGCAKGDEGEGPAGRIRSLAEGCLVWSSLCKASSKVNAMMARWQEGEWMTVNQKKYRFLHKRFLPLPAQHQVTRRTNAPSYLFSHIIFF